MRARPWASSVMIGTCQPSQERAGTPMLRKVMASSPAVTCSPEATTASYSSSRRPRSDRPAPGAVGPGHQLVGLAGHGRDDHRDPTPAPGLGRHEPGDAADALQVGHRGAAEFHHQTRHEPAPSARERARSSGGARSGQGRRGPTRCRGDGRRSPASTPTMSPASRPWPTNGGTRPASSRRCTGSIRPAWLSSARPASRISAATPGSETPFAGLRLLDVGCGGGLVCRADDPPGIRGDRHRRRPARASPSPAPRRQALGLTSTIADRPPRPWWRSW